MWPFETPEICRTCGSKGANMTCIFNKCKFQLSETTICDAILLCASVLIFEGDGLPEQICSRCIKEIERAYAFRKMCEGSDALFRNDINSRENPQDDSKPESGRRSVLETINIKLESGNDDETELNNLGVTNLNADVTSHDISEAFDSAPEKDVSTNSVTEPVNNNIKVEAYDPLNVCQKLDKNTLELIKNSSTQIKNRKLKHFACKVCKKNFDTRKNLKDHSPCHMLEKPWTCGQSLHQEDELGEEHFQGELHECKVCSLKNMIPEVPAKHVGFQLPTGKDLPSETVVNNNSDLKVSVGFNDEDQNVVSNNLCNRRKHRNDKGDKSIGDSQSHEDRVDVGSSRPKNPKKTFPCRLCNKPYATKNQLSQHLRVHGNYKQFLCSICGKSFCSNTSLSEHLLTHTGEKPHKCDMCDKSFTYGNSLKVHKRIHTGERPYKCSFCDRRFIQWTDRRTHERSHSGQKFNKCKLCDQEYVKAASLIVHMRAKHTNERPYKCKYCPKSFFTEQYLGHHVGVHTGCRPFVCSTCGKTYLRVTHLSRHVKLKHDPK